jgi:PAS domain S-box-containing protein
MKLTHTIETAPVSSQASLSLTIAEYAPLPMATVEGASHIVRDVNAAFCRLLGKAKEQLVGKAFCEMLPDTEQCGRLLDSVYSTGEPESHTEQKVTKPQPIFWSYTMWPVVEEGRPVGVLIQVTETALLHGKTVALNEALMLGSVRQHELTEVAEKLNAQLQVEIIERKEVEAALNRAQALLTDRAAQLEVLVAERTAELTTTNKQLEAMVYTIAHDLRAPLRSMQGYSVMLMDEAGIALSKEGREFAERISASAQFMDELLMDLITFSAIAQEPIELTPVKLEAVIQSAVSRFQKEIQEKNGRVESAGPWPDVVGNFETLGKVLLNLVGNALKFSVPNVPPLVRLRAEERAGYIRVWVEDNGIGIAPEHQHQIFALFTRLQGKKFPGTGIGLAIVEKAMERLGGRAGVESAAGKGSRFWFELRKV